MKPRALFILKRREDYSTDLINFTNKTVSTGMFNSANFVCDMLNKAGIEANVVIVMDNNSIDKEVALYNPTHVFIEGYWVVPEKFDVLKKLHPHVKWIVRCHSEAPFLAQEGIAMEWTFEYLKRGVIVAGNSPRINREIRIIAKAGLGLSHEEIEAQIPLLTNFCPVSTNTFSMKRLEDYELNVGCFGAFRPLKNHLIQAIAAIEFAEQHNLKLRFHVNGGRVEMNGENPLKNLRALFANLPNHDLIEHPWASHETFLSTIKKMDICMQVSFTETFNIVTADAVNMGIPVVVSSEVVWANKPFADPTSTQSIVEVMNEVWVQRHHIIESNRASLKEYSRRSKTRWVEYLTNSRTMSFGRTLLLDLENFFDRF